MATFPRDTTSRVLLAIPHGGLNEGIRGLLATEFESVVMVADEGSLLECAETMRPNLAVLDLCVARGDGARLIERLHAMLPDTKVLVVGPDEATVARVALGAGADGYLRISALGSALLPEVERLLGWGKAPA